MNEGSKNKPSKKYLIKLYTVTLFYQLANALILPMVPYLANNLNATSQQYSLTFTVYYIAQLISSLGLGKISDWFGRWVALSIAHVGLTVFTTLQIFTSNIWVFILLRAFTGLFDASTALFQAYMSDITSSNNRAHYLSQLEAVNNFAQCVGPLIGGILSSISLVYTLVATSVFYAISAIVTVFILDESNPAILEKRKVMKNLKELNLPAKEYEEQKRQILFQLNVQQEGNQSHASSAKWKFNYVIVIALIGEFCSRWIVNIFDVSFAAFGEEHFQVSSFEFSMASAMGSFINIFQTGWLFNVFLKHDVSIPVISSLGGITGVIGILLCVLTTNKYVALVGSLCFLVAYGFVAPTAPTVMTTELPPSMQGVASSLVLLGGQSAYIVAPSALSGLYSLGIVVPFYVSLFPCLVLFVVMIVLNFIPGGRTAGQVPLRFAMENLAKEAKLESLDNEREMEELARSDCKKGDKPEENDAGIEMTIITKDGENDARIEMETHAGVQEDDFFVPPRMEESDQEMANGEEMAI
ncbi:hypothetical protein WA538_003053 [Blastocystis sp. DL]